MLRLSLRLTIVFFYLFIKYSNSNSNSGFAFAFGCHRLDLDSQIFSFQGRTDHYNDFNYNSMNYGLYY